MPTERERDYHNPEPDGYGQHNSELKSTDEPSFRLRFLNEAESIMYNFQPIPFTIKSIIVALAGYGLYKIIFPS